MELVHVSLWFKCERLKEALDVFSVTTLIVHDYEEI